MHKTQLVAALGMQYPIFSAGIGAAAGPELVAAVSNSGGCGILGTASLSGKYVAQQIDAVRALTARTFGVNIVLPLLRKGQFEACLERAVPLLVLFWGDPSPYVEAAHSAGTKVFVQVGSVSEALDAVAAGVDGIIAQGFEAGGHVRGTTSLSVLVPQVVDAVSPVPVIASGGIADGRGLVAALALGAEAVCMGTRFLASTEANAASEYKARVAGPGPKVTVCTELFDGGWEGAPHRVLRNEMLDAWERAGCPPSGSRPREGASVGTMTSGGRIVEIPAYSAYVPERGASVSMDDAAMYAGECCSLISQVQPAAEIVRSIVHQASTVLEKLAR
jgi:NAD(P)H-dependent flavin oxidoreductase YrpB (nitropropane dioxygenase family)